MALATSTTRTRPRGSLTRQEIIKEALTLLEQQGPGALQMRRLADRLGVAPNALYYHVRGKADLIDGLVDQLYAGRDLDPDPSGDWTQQLTTLSQGVRAHLLVQLAPLLARSSTDDQFQFGIRTFLAGLNAQQPEREHSA